MKVKAEVVACVVVAVVGGALIARLTGAPRGGSPGGDESLPVLRKGCRQAVASVESGRGKVTIESWDSPNPESVNETKGEYQVAFRGEAYRLTHKTTVERNEVPPGDPEKRYLLPAGAVALVEAAYDGQKMTVYHPQRSSATIASPLPGSRPMMQPEHAEYAAVCIPGHGVVDLEHWFAPSDPNRASQARVLRRETIDQHECIVVEWRWPARTRNRDRTMTAAKWIAPDAGFTILRERTWVEGAGISGKQLGVEVDCEVREYAAGVWGPARWVEEDYGLTETGETRKKSRTVVTYDPEFKLNVPVSDEDLRLSLPSGTRVRDELVHAVYTVP